MKVLRGFDDPAPVRGGFVSIGNFDGVHRGHQSMIAALVRNARQHQAPAVVLTFDPHPIAVLRPEQAPPPLSSTDQKLERLAECGVDATIVYPTDRALLDLTPREFFDRIIEGTLGAAGLVEGPNFNFGRGRAGTVETLRDYCSAARLELEIVPPLKIGERFVSSTEIRRLIGSGQMRESAALLGSPYRLRGTVVRGAERGRTIGFPTANLAGIATLIPPDGVYAGRALAEGAWYAAGINLGPNPTFQEQQRKVEIHLIDFQGDLYGREMEVEFLERLRDTTRFSGVEELKVQLQRDIARTRELVNPTGRG
jgi:riboflavin kinase / FMN adenylyltransferase